MPKVDDHLCLLDECDLMSLILVDLWYKQDAELEVFCLLLLSAAVDAKRAWDIVIAHFCCCVIIQSMLSRPNFTELSLIGWYVPMNGTGTMIFPCDPSQIWIGSRGEFVIQWKMCWELSISHGKASRFPTGVLEAIEKHEMAGCQIVVDKMARSLIVIDISGWDQCEGSMWQRCLVWTALRKIYVATLLQEIYGNAVKDVQLMCTRTEIQMQCRGR